MMTGTIHGARHLNLFSIDGRHNVNVERSTDSMGASIGDYGNPKWFMGEYHNVFVGKVNHTVGEKRVVGIQVIEFSVTPLYNIKGRLTNSIILTSANRSPDPMLVPGKTYIIGARYDASDGTYGTGASIYSFVLISDDESASDAELIALAQKNPRVIELQNAYPCETVSPVDVASRHAYNSYATRCLDASGNLIDDTLQAMNEMKGLPKAECVTPLAPLACQMQTPTPTIRPELRVTPQPTNIVPPPILDSPQPETFRRWTPSPTPIPSRAPIPTRTPIPTPSPIQEPSPTPTPSATPTVPVTSSTSHPFIPSEPSATSVITATSAR